MEEIKRLEKNKKIRESFIETKQKRLSQSCHVFKMKIQSNKLSKVQQEFLKMMFVEAKWIINDIISNSSDEHPIWKYKLTNEINKKDKDMNDVKVQLKYLGSQMKQNIVSDLISNIRTLSTLKKRGHKIGKLKFRKECKSINLKQYGITYKFINKNKVKIQGIKKPLYINGLDQVYNKNYELANAKLLNTSNGYYLAVTCYKNKEEKIYDNSNEIGIDFGISTHLTLSNGKKFNASVQESDRLKNLQRKLSKQQKRSKNSYKTITLIRKEYEKMSNKKNDLANKIVSDILKNRYIFMQDEQLSKWKIQFGKQIHHSILGRVKEKLKRHNNVYVLGKFEPTTKMCYNCGQINEIKLSDRIYTCDCGIEPEDRDIHAAKNMIVLSKIKLGMEHTEFTPVDIKTSDSNIKFDGRSRKLLSEEDTKSLA